MGDHVDPRGLDAELAVEALAAVLGVDDDRVEALVQTPLRGALARPGFARQDVVRGDHEHRPPAPAREQEAVEILARAATGSARRRRRLRGAR